MFGDDELVKTIDVVDGQWQASCPELGIVIRGGAADTDGYVGIKLEDAIRALATSLDLPDEMLPDAAAYDRKTLLIDNGWIKPQRRGPRP